MSTEGFEEWDADFWDQVILKAEELAVSSTKPTQHQPPLPPLPPAPPRFAASHGDIRYSPPRELSQRVKDTNKGFDQSANGSVAPVPYVRGSQNAKEQEIDRLKGELGRVSKQLTRLERECLELRKERDKKEEQLTSSQIETKDADAHCKKSTNLEYGAHIQDQCGIPLGCQNTNSSKDQVGSQINVGIGVQTDKTGESTNLTIKNDLSATESCSKKLLGIWDPPSGQPSGSNLVSKLFVACETDFHVLFGCLSSNMSSKTTKDCPAAESSSGLALQHHRQPAYSDETAKVSHLYSTLTKICNDTVKLEALLKVLVDLCGLENVVIVYRSLRVLRMVLNHLFSMERKSEKRDNVMVERPSSGNKTADIFGYKCSEIQSLFDADANETSDPDHIPFGTRFFDAEIFRKKEVWNHGSTLLRSHVDWVSLFELMHQIAVQNNEEHVRLEAVSMMNMILMRTSAYLEREKFGRVLVFRSVSRLLRKEAGLGVQKQAVHLLYLLLNCPKLMAIFCSGCEEAGGNAGAANSEATNASDFEGFSAILEGLADCVACNGNGTQELKLRRNAIVLLAFLASSGKSGFEILLGLRLSKRTNLLALILQILISEMDAEAAKSVQPSEIFKERTLLIREALILLNRLVSNLQYSTPTLRVLTNNRNVACLTIDIANRLSRKGKWLWQSDMSTRQMRESEIVDLARVFKKRVFTFLGDSIS